VQPLLLPPQPQPEQEPLQSISLEEIFANLGLVLNLQLIPEDERDTDAPVAVR
jgi:hypothetical protein